MADGSDLRGAPEAIPVDRTVVPLRPRDVARARGDILAPPVFVRTCLGCGCSQARACPGGCAWVRPDVDLCSACVGHSPASWAAFRCDPVEEAARPQTQALLEAVADAAEANSAVCELLAGRKLRGLSAEGERILSLYLTAAGAVIDALNAPARYAKLGEAILRELEALR